MKKKCAYEALKYIHDDMIVGLGGGSTIGYLIQYIHDNKLNIKVVTPSLTTANLCLTNHIQVLPTYMVDHIDIAFDGCDEVDLNLNALKSNGAIHTQEKIIASLAKQYVLLVDESKFFEKLPFHHPVTLEVLLDARFYVIQEIKQLGGQISYRTSSAKDGYTISDNGNIIMEAIFEEVNDIKQLDHDLKHITGIVDTSLFVDKVSFVLSVDEDHIRKIEKEKFQ
ncbi:MAG: ribose 5-phosphate isomerase A [Erysipelotrichaceae bacterium]|nr:ribose 5-phosphate isomerase A [Erysipelotrichaceae bacterium]